MSIEENVQIVKDFFAAIGEHWPLAGTHRAHAGVEDVLQKASEEIEMTYPKPPSS